jgi:hypothetical protein
MTAILKRDFLCPALPVALEVSTTHASFLKSIQNILFASLDTGTTEKTGTICGDKSNLSLKRAAKIAKIASKSQFLIAHHACPF